MGSVYTTRLQKGGALLREMRLLTTIWSDRLGIADQLIAENALALPSRARAQDVIMRAFVPRLVRGDPPNLWKPLAILEESGSSVELLRPVHYLSAARSEPLLADFVRDELAERNRVADLEVSVEDVLRFMDCRPVALYGGSRWSNDVQIKVARGLLAALRDFGVLEGAAHKRLVLAHLPLGAFAFVAFVISLSEPSGERLIHHPDWRLYLLSPALVERMLIEAQQYRLLQFQAAGRVARIDFPAHDIEGYARVIAQRAA